MHTKGTVCFIVYLPVTGYTYSTSESYYCLEAPGLYREFIDQPSRIKQATVPLRDQKLKKAGNNLPPKSETDQSHQSRF
uniref:Uncharacterized protein n=1 Tax=Timema shepardi TaxID=629360 RepID=A0A7R9G1R3_TIMSH|nr:unnamed protein product [Timema shepardi]